MTDPPVSITRRAQPGEPVPGRRPGAGAGTTVARTVAVRATVPPSRYPPGGRPSCRGRPLLAGRVPARIDAWLRAGCQARPRAGPGGLDGAGGVEAGCLRSRAAGQPAPPAGTRAGRLHPRQRRGRARGHRPGPPRARPCRPSPPAGPGRLPAPPRRAARPRGLSSFPVPRAGRPGQPPAAAGPAGAGLDAAGGAERPSSRTHGRAAPGNANRSRPAPRHPGRTQPGTPGDPLLTIEEVTAELRVSRAAFYRWRRQGAGPPAVRLPGGGVRVRRSALSRGCAAWKKTRKTDRSRQQMDSYDVRFWDIKKLAQRHRQPGTGSGGPSTGASTASRSRPAPSPTGSSTA